MSVNNASKLNSYPISVKDISYLISVNDAFQLNSYRQLFDIISMTFPGSVSSGTRTHQRRAALPPTVRRNTTSRQKIPYLPSDRLNRPIPPTQCGETPSQGRKFPISLHGIFSFKRMMPLIPAHLRFDFLLYQFSLTSINSFDIKNFCTHLYYFLSENDAVFFPIIQAPFT